MVRAERIRVPDSDAPWYPDVVSFALSYNAYERHGGRESAYAVATPGKEALKSGSALPDDLDVLRAALFLHQRAFHHFGETPAGSDRERINRLLDAISVARSAEAGRAESSKDLVAIGSRRPTPRLPSHRGQTSSA